LAATFKNQLGIEMGRFKSKREYGGDGAPQGADWSSAPGRKLEKQLQKLLTHAELEKLKGDLPEWKLDDSNTRIEKRFKFAAFSEAFAFMTRVAMLAETLDHHPEWHNVYSTVTIGLTTHSAKGLTALDTELARRIDGLLAN
jgi:4a-hydroxytetrahydrobiopterin dehydratase